MEYTIEQLEEMLEEKKREVKKVKLLKTQAGIRTKIQELHKKFLEIKDEIIAIENQSPNRDKRNQANISGLKNVDQLIVAILTKMQQEGKRRWTVNEIVNKISETQKHIGIPISCASSTVRSRISHMVRNDFLQVCHNLPGKGAGYVLCFKNFNAPRRFQGVKIEDLAAVIA